MAEVYWIHLPEHTDMFSEGYIGITSKTTKERFRTHLKEAKRKDRKKYRIHNALAKYGDSVTVETLVICDDDYAIDLEAKLRPTPKIGWNTLAGGQNVKLLRDVKETILHTEDSKDKMKVSQKKSWEVNRESKLSKIVATRKPLKRPLDELGNPTKFWVSSRYSITRNSEYWKIADIFHSFYISKEVCASTDLIRNFNIDERKRQWFAKLIKYFDAGWNPSEDSLWIEDFKQEGGVNAAFVIPSP